MRAPSKHVGKSAKRDERRARYQAYITSAAWREVREGWLQEHQVRFTDAPTCEVSGSAWRLSRDDLHHHTYARLGAEAFEDLAPLCRDDHARVHATIRRSRSWSRMKDVAASRKVIAGLRRTQKSFAEWVTP